MRTILYCRVSSDEQAKGASLEVQESYLRSYCVNHGYEVVGIYKEDYSAKHHDLRRPEFNPHCSHPSCNSLISNIQIF